MTPKLLFSVKKHRAILSNHNAKQNDDLGKTCKERHSNFYVSFVFQYYPAKSENDSKRKNSSSDNFPKRPKLYDNELESNQLKQPHLTEQAVSPNSSEEIDTAEVAGAALRFIRENGVSVTEFAEKVARFQRAHVSLTLNHPVPLDKCR